MFKSHTFTLKKKIFFSLVYQIVSHISTSFFLIIILNSAIYTTERQMKFSFDQTHGGIVEDVDEAEEYGTISLILKQKWVYKLDISFWAFQVLKESFSSPFLRCGVVSLAYL